MQQFTVIFIMTNKLYSLIRKFYNCLCVYCLILFGVLIAPVLISICCLPSIDYDYYDLKIYVKLSRD